MDYARRVIDEETETTIETESEIPVIKNYKGKFEAKTVKKDLRWEQWFKDIMNEHLVD